MFGTDTSGTYWPVGLAVALFLYGGTTYAPLIYVSGVVAAVFNYHALSETRINPQFLELELTESLLTTNADLAFFRPQRNEENGSQARHR